MQVRSTDTQESKGRGKHLIIARRIEVGLFIAMAIQGSVAAATTPQHQTPIDPASISAQALSATRERLNDGQACALSFNTQSPVAKIYDVDQACGYSLPASKMKVNGTQVPYEQLAIARSLPGESQDDFVKRTAPLLRAYSGETTFEACGVIASDSKGQYGMVIGTNKAHIACANANAFVPEGMVATGETLHSHGADKSFSANASDKALMSHRLLGGGTGALTVVHGQTLTAFSADDYSGGPGYLAMPGNKVLHQKGKGTEREL